MPDTYTTTTSTSWFERMRGALLGLLIGPVLVLGAVVLMFWNEGRAVHTAQDLAEGRGQVVDVAFDKLAPDNEGRLVHLSGSAKTSDKLADDHFGVSTEAIKLSRDVEMYQWTESKKTETKKKLGGGEDTVTTFSYEKKWAKGREDSSRFDSSAEHQNPTLRVEPQEWVAEDVRLGAFRLSPGLLEEWNAFELLPVKAPTSEADATTAATTTGMLPYDGGFYLGKNPQEPQIGDLRVKFRVVKPAVVSVIAAQKGDTFEPYLTSHQRRLDEMLAVGTLDADTMFTREEQENTLWTWILRAVGFGVATLGLAIFLSPLTVLADVVPFVGRLVGFGVLLIALVFGGLISIVTIAIAWLFYRPILGIGLLLLALVIFLLVRRRFRKPAVDPFLASMHAPTV